MGAHRILKDLLDFVDRFSSVMEASGLELRLPVAGGFDFPVPVPQVMAGQKAIDPPQRRFRAVRRTGSERYKSSILRLKRFSKPGNSRMLLISEA